MATTAAIFPVKQRLGSVDLLRGIVMVVMALDHVRDYFSDARIDPTDLDQTTVPLFFTRWITHYCAPTFVFLAGTGAFLSKKPKPELARFLLTRGMWLVVLELTYMRMSWAMELSPRVFGVQVIWAIGWSMVALAALVWLPVAVVGAIAVAMMALHDLADGVHADALGAAAPLWHLAHEQGIVPLFAGRALFVVYPLVPWIGVMAAGYAFGAVLRGDEAVRRKRLYVIGGAAVLAFVIVRGINLYGDPSPWTAQRSAVFTVLSFLNCSKYPPSLCYLLMTLGPGILALPLLERARGPFADAITTFGRVPLFYYMLHVPLIHAAAIAAAYARFGSVPARMFGGPFGEPWPDGYGYSLLGVYVVWIAVVALLFPACRWFAGVKRRRNDAWLSYL